MYIYYHLVQDSTKIFYKILLKYDTKIRLQLIISVIDSGHISLPKCNFKWVSGEARRFFGGFTTFFCGMGVSSKSVYHMKVHKVVRMQFPPSKASLESDCKSDPAPL